jgi:DNA-binding MarR family transcriptional regulator
MVNQRKEYVLNAQQIYVLRLLYKFRFITASFLAQYKGISRSACNQTMAILVKRELVDRHYSKNYKLLGKAARYYLTAKGIKYLKDNFSLNEAVLHAMYKNKSVTEHFIDHHIDTEQAFLHLKQNYPDQFYVHTRNEQARFDSFPSPRSDLWLKPTEAAQSSIQYFIELSHDVAPFLARKRLESLLQNYDEDWQEEKYPTVCFVLADGRAEQNFQGYAKQVLDSSGMEDEVTIVTTSIKASQGANPAIWTDVLEPEKLIALS